MATKRKVSQSKRQGKQAAKNAEHVLIKRDDLARCRRLLERAQREAIMAAPQRIPRIGWGAEAALDAFNTIWIVDGLLARAEAEEVSP